MAKIPRISHLVLALIAFIPIYTTWIGAGMRSPLQDLLPWFAGLCLLAHLVLPQQDRSWRQRTRALLRDPFFWCMLPLLVLIGIQWANAGRTLVYEAMEDTWLMTDPPLTGWPSAMDPYEAREMWNWFFPITVLTGVLRGRLATVKEGRLLTGALLMNAGLLAVSGVVVLARQSIQPTESPPESFATFGYQNHAGIFFCLMLCLAFGHLLDRLTRPKAVARWPFGLIVLAALACLAGAFLSLSRAAMLLAAGACILFVIDLIFQFRKSLTPVRILNGTVALLALSVTAFFIAGGTNAIWIQQEASSLRHGIGGQLLSDSRVIQLQAAVRIWQDHLWFGTGGWGFRHLPALYVSPAEWEQVVEAGAANVHCDFIQFLSEFGIVGMAALLGAGGLLVSRLLKHRLYIQQAAVRWTLIGFGCVCLSSLIDLPFRNSAILQHSLIILAVAGVFATQTTSTNRSPELD